MRVADAGEAVEATFNRRYVMQKLEYGRGRVWQDVQQKVKTYVLASDLSGLKLEQFIHVLDLINRCRLAAFDVPPCPLSPTPTPFLAPTHPPGGSPNVPFFLSLE